MSKLSLEERFWSKVDKNGPVVRIPLSNCWVWTAGKFQNGYGAFGADGKLKKAHRVAWELVNAIIPIGTIIRHVCDNKSCCNPNHLELGSAQDNANDMILRNRQAKGLRSGHYTKPERTARGERHGRYTKPHRTARGESIGNSKMSSDDISAILVIWSTGLYTQSQIGEMFGVVQTTISQIVRRRTWKD